MVADVVDIKKARAGDMGGAVFGAGIAALIGHVPRRIQHPQIGVFKMRGQPVG